MAELRSSSSMCSCIYWTGIFVESFRREKRCLKNPCFDILPGIVGAIVINVYNLRRGYLRELHLHVMRSVKHYFGIPIIKI